MSNTAQKRALRNYRTRLVKQGMARFEVLGLDADRELIRSIAKRLAEDDPEASRIRAAVRQTIAGNPPKKAASSPRCGGHPSLGSISILPVRVTRAAKSTCDAVSPRHQHHQ